MIVSEEGASKSSKKEEQKPKQDISGEKKESAEVTAKPQEATGGCDAFEESLICIICQEILHDCIRWELNVLCICKIMC